MYTFIQFQFLSHANICPVRQDDLWHCLMSQVSISSCFEREMYDCRIVQCTTNYLIFPVMKVPRKHLSCGYMSVGRITYRMPDDATECTGPLETLSLPGAGVLIVPSPSAPGLGFRPLRSNELAGRGRAEAAVINEAP